MCKILIASDRLAVRTYLRNVCQDCDFTVCDEANSPEQALASSELHLPDIVILSFRSSVRKQAPVVSKITRLRKKVSVLMYSSFPLSRATQAYIRAGASGFLGEESTSEELIAVLGGLMAGFSMIPINAREPRKIKLAHRPSKSLAPNDNDSPPKPDLLPEETTPLTPSFPGLCNEV